MSLATVQEGITDKEIKEITKNFEDASEYYIDIEGEQGYGIPIKASEVTTKDGSKIEGYPWGSNSFVVNTAIVMAYAYDLTENDKYLDGAKTALDYIMGRNPLDNCYVTGYGTHSSENPHHRWWSNQVDNQFPSAPDGVLVGGPNSGLQDPWVKGLGWNPGENAPQLCYVDHIEAWCTNECTINWNAPLAWMTGFFTDEPIREVGALKYDDGSDDEEDDEKKEKPVTEKKKTNNDDDKDTEEVSKDKDDDSDLSFAEKAKAKIKDICAYIGAGVVGLLVLIGLVNGLVTIVKGIFKKKKK